MSLQMDGEKEINPIEMVREEYIANGKITFKKLSEKYEIPLEIIKETAKQENWRAMRKNAVHKENDKNGGVKPLVDGDHRNELKGVPPLPSARDEIREESSDLRRLAFGIATKAGKVCETKDEWGPKDFDLVIGTWAKIVGVQAKLDGDADGIEKLIDELTEGDEHPDAL